MVGAVVYWVNEVRGIMVSAEGERKRNRISTQRSIYPRVYLSCAGLEHLLMPLLPGKVPPGPFAPITMAGARMPAKGAWPGGALPALLVATNVLGEMPMRSGDCRAPTSSELGSNPAAGPEPATVAS